MKIKYILSLVITLLLPLPWIVCWFMKVEPSPLVQSCISGMAIVGAAFLLSWTCEVAEKDISRSLAVAILALITVLPEYAVDIYLAWQAGKDHSYIAYATANMTGANRLLIGFGWAFLVFINFCKRKEKEIRIDKAHSIEITMLTIATAYSFLLPLKRTISPFDFIPFFLIYCVYIYLAQKAEVIEPEIVGPAELIANMEKNKRRTMTVLMFLYSAFCILISAKHFAEGLIATGRHFHIEEFLLVQWIAPLASESPEIIVASLLVLRNKVGPGMGTLISSKINQWTLLISMLPLVFSWSSGKWSAMPLDTRQSEEILLTAAQSLFGVAVFCNLSLSLWESGLLFGLFAVQLIMPSTHVRYIFSLIYFVLALVFIFIHRKGFSSIFKFTALRLTKK